MLEIEDIVENLGPPLPGQKTTFCHLGRSDPQILSLGRSGIAQGEVDTGEMHEVCILNGDPDIIPCSEPSRYSTI